MKVEKGRMVINENGEAWQCLYEDGRSTAYGWGPLETGDLYDRYCRKPADITYSGSHYVPELRKRGRVVEVERRTDVTVISNKP